MSEYLSKEEVKQWRSSLEKITLEEYAARLGKTIEEDKPTNDIVDFVLRGKPVMSRIEDSTQTRGEKITSIAQRTFDREREISNSFSAKEKTVTKKIEKAIIKPQKTEIKAVAPSDALREEVRLVFSKALTEREQMVFDYFANNKNKIVYAKDLASLLDLPRDYVYKYIKNLRSKIEGDRLQNSDNGGYVLNA